jgi:TRAP-type C4-dicarboxylate transport system permease small subunit
MGDDVRRVLDGLYLFSGHLAGVFLIAIFAMMMGLSVGRELGLNVKSGDDITAWFMAGMGLLGLAHTFKKGELIRMGLVVDRLEGPARRWLETVVLLLATLLVAFLAWYAVRLTYESWQLNDMSTGVLVIPLWIPQLGFSVGSVILLIAVVDELVHVALGGFPRYAKTPPRTREEVIERSASGNL